MKNTIRIITLNLAFILSASLYAANPYNADIVVAQDGTGDFTLLQAAINAAPSNSTRRTVIYIKRGLYNTEKVIVPAEKANITLIGESRDESIISYHVYNCSTGICPAEDAAKWTSDNITTTATLTILGNGFRAENLTIRNTAGPVGQALAITVKSDKCVFINCNLLGYQDTIYMWNVALRTYFKGCLVLGRTDYVYGGGIGYFDGCEIRSYGGGWITAPSTGALQPYGFVFNDCTLTYTSGSPRAGDDGTLIRLGRPWHGSPKVAWLYCNMCAEINPEGWGDTWGMDSVTTAPTIKLLEYKNTGPGADMTNRAKWATLRAMTDVESLDYTVQQVMKGSDGWDPTVEAPAVQTYTWKGTGVSTNWLDSTSWDPKKIPASGESASVSGNLTLTANGGTFVADLLLNPGSKLDVTSASTVNFLSLDSAEIAAVGTSTLSGKIATKDSSRFTVDGQLEILATITGVHNLIKAGAGKLLLNADNSNYSGTFLLKAGSIEAKLAKSLGKGSVTVKSGAYLIISADNAIDVKSKLQIESGGTVILNNALTLNQLYINGVIQNPGLYNSTTHPTVFSGAQSIMVGRPTMFTFQQASAKRWGTAANYIPALLPLAGDTAFVNVEMEADAVAFAATLLVKKNIRLVGNAVSTGDIIMYNGAFFSYATSGVGFSLTAPLVVDSAIYCQMSGNAAGNAMTFNGPIRGKGSIQGYNYTNTASMVAKVVLAGDNSNFTGTWDGTRASRVATSSGAFDGTVANAFGAGKITIGSGNKVYFSHAQASSTKTSLAMVTGATAVMNTNATVGKLILDGVEYTSGSFTATSHPTFFQGTGTLTVSVANELASVQNLKPMLQYDGQSLHFSTNIQKIEMYNTLGQCLLKSSVTGGKLAIQLPQGMYVFRLMDAKTEYRSKLTINWH
jgi:autotransporter-associated beta strand protein